MTECAWHKEMLALVEVIHTHTVLYVCGCHSQHPTTCILFCVCTWTRAVAPCMEDACLSFVYVSIVLDDLD